ncbi:MAG: cofactor assembly of complex C subunit B [Acaryochloridaceae cyanobacterium SU_2_1]|nr:cofactor assembly of complex C subunit B [Acaryochloridaceae cyanobacterium SU_2_1]NJM95515.1 cofactor assembly of complex C subunit B [Acaryochloridaceae cyanobacterium CSU_5_19]
MSRSNTNAIIRLLPLGVGGLGGILLLVNRLLTPALTNAQARSDAVGVIICAVLILTGLLWQRVQPRSPEAVLLVGDQGFELASDLPEALKIELAWASHSLLTNTVTQSLVIWHQGQVLLRRGILGPVNRVVPGPIVERVLQSGKPVYLVALKLYPGRLEFNYLPENTQGVICQPIGNQGVLVLGANVPRSYTQQDEAWVAAIAHKLDHSLTHQGCESIALSG